MNRVLTSTFVLVLFLTLGCSSIYYKLGETTPQEAEKLDQYWDADARVLYAGFYTDSSLKLRIEKSCPFGEGEGKRDLKKIYTASSAKNPKIFKTRYSPFSALGNVLWGAYYFRRDLTIYCDPNVDSE